LVVDCKPGIRKKEVVRERGRELKLGRGCEKAAQLNGSDTQG